MAAIHEKGFAHRDLKLENILVNKGDVLKIGDFGFAKIIDGKFVTPLGTEVFCVKRIIRAY
jgi:serine/threonine protein kinase